MIITGRQQESFKTDALRKFEDEMLEHIRTYFVNHYKTVGEPALRRSIQFGYARARRYGLRSSREVCMYLNNMILLGSNFDVDPQYPWSAALLADKLRPADERISELSERTLAFMAAIGGPANRHIFRALLNLTNNSEAIFKQLQVGSPDGLLAVLHELYPQKAAAVGTDRLRHMVTMGIRDGSRYGITSWPAISIYGLFMFTLGSGFDTDPQFPWAADILLDPTTTDASDKTTRLFRSAVRQLKMAIDGYEK
jgi:hypothetical protein